MVAEEQTTRDNFATEVGRLLRLIRTKLEWVGFRSGEVDALIGQMRGLREGAHYPANILDGLLDQAAEQARAVTDRSTNVINSLDSFEADWGKDLHIGG